MLLLKDVDAARNTIRQLAFDLHETMRDHVAYWEKSPTGAERRPVIIIKTPEQLQHVEGVRQNIIDIRTQVESETGSALRFVEPVLVKDVLFFKVYVGTERSSSYSTTSKEQIIANITKQISLLERLAQDGNDSARINIVLLQKELAFFKNDWETQYRLRTMGMPSSNAELKLTNHGAQTVRIPESGLFIVGPDFQSPTYDFPTGKKPRKQRATFYDLVKPVQYSLAINSHCYRESEVVAAKIKAGYDDRTQSDIKQAHRNKLKAGFVPADTADARAD